MPPTPPAMPVRRLIDHDAVDPGPECGLAAEPADGAEDTQEHLLRQVEGFVVIAQQMKRELIDHALVLGDQLGARVLVASRTAADQRQFVAADIGPDKGADGLHRNLFRHLKPFQHLLDPPTRGKFPYSWQMRRLLAALLLAALVITAGLAMQRARTEANYRALIDAGEAVLAGGRTHAAVEAFSGALAFRPASMAAHLRRGEAYQRQGALAAAERDLTMAAQLDPSATQPLERLAEVAAARGDHGRAADWYAKAADRD